MFSILVRFNMILMATFAASNLQHVDSLSIYRNSLTSLSLQVPTSDPSTLPLPVTIPVSNLIPNTRFLVDAFLSPTPSSITYFLSHFHSDHYNGLSPQWSHGLVFCSPITANLLTEILKVSPEFVFQLPLRKPVVIDGSEVTLVDANHCPGAVQFLFKAAGKGSPTCGLYVHTGDFRFRSSMKEDEILSQFIGCDMVFLDTTYCNPKFLFPLQEESTNYIVDVIHNVGGEFTGVEKNTLFLIATYVIGKERILIEIARKCKRKVFVDARKMRVLHVLGYGESGLFTEDMNQSDVHVVGWNVLGETRPYFRPKFSKVEEIMVERGYSRVVGFVATGWTYETKHNKFAVKSKNSLEIHLVPYSEHSNYTELREYVKFLRPKRVIPTVGADNEKRDCKLADKMQKHFSGLLDEMANKKAFLTSLSRRANDHEMNHVSGEELASSSSSVPHDLTMANTEETEKLMNELNSCLPKWVNKDQLLDLIKNSSSNLVEAVSNFYEHETEFHKQVFGDEHSSSSPQSGLADEPFCFIQTASLMSDHDGSNGIALIQTPNKSSIIKLSAKSGKKSLPKRRVSIDNKLMKRVKSKSKPDPSGSKQSTITSFFNHSQNASIVSTHKQLEKDKNMESNDGELFYAADIEKFIQITDGDESSKGYAAAILQKTKGNINEALDVHYCNFGEGENTLKFTDVLVQSQFLTTNDCSYDQERNVSEEAEGLVDHSVQENLKEDPTEHGLLES